MQTLSESRTHENSVCCVVDAKDRDVDDRGVVDRDVVGRLTILLSFLSEVEVNVVGVVEDILKWSDH